MRKYSLWNSFIPYLSFIEVSYKKRTDKILHVNGFLIPIVTNKFFPRKLQYNIFYFLQLLLKTFITLIVSLRH